MRRPRAVQAIVFGIVAFVGTRTHAVELCGISKPLCVSASTQLRRLSTADTGDQTRWVTLQLWTPWSISVDPAASQVTLKSRYGGANMLGDGTTPGASDWTTTGGKISSCSGSVGSGTVVLHAGSGDISLTFSGANLIEVVDPAQRAVLKQNWSGMNVADAIQVTMRSVASRDGGGAGHSQPRAWDVKDVSPACSGAMGAQPDGAPAPENQKTAKELHREAETEALKNVKELGRVVEDVATKSIENAGKDMDEIKFKSSGSKEKAAALARKDQSTDLDGDTSEDAVVIGPLVVKWVAPPAPGSAPPPSATNTTSTAACTKWTGVYNLFTNMAGDFQMDIWSVETDLSVPETWAYIADHFANDVAPPSAKRWAEQAKDFAAYRHWFGIVSQACAGPKMTMVGKCGPMPAALDVAPTVAACTSPTSTPAACTAALTLNMAQSNALSRHFTCVTEYVADYK